MQSRSWGPPLNDTKLQTHKSVTSPKEVEKKPNLTPEQNHTNMQAFSPHHPLTQLNTPTTIIVIIILIIMITDKTEQSTV